LEEAQSRGAGRILIACNLDGVPTNAAEVIIAPLVGPEVITGATRLRAATACKMVLNMTTVATMALTGRVYENLAVDVPKRSDKLVARAMRIVRTLSPDALAKCSWDHDFCSLKERTAWPLIFICASIPASPCERSKTVQYEGNSVLRYDIFPSIVRQRPDIAAKYA
jgi:N-acetylmuramic acid 6-phosphate (MurNAc-6-P) etherase